MGLDNFVVVCDDNTQEMIDNRELRIEMWLKPEDSRHEMTFIVDKDGVTDFRYRQFAMFGGRWFSIEPVED